MLRSPEGAVFCPGNPTILFVDLVFPTAANGEGRNQPPVDSIIERAVGWADFFERLGQNPRLDSLSQQRAVLHAYQILTTAEEIIRGLEEGK